MFLQICHTFCAAVSDAARGVKQCSLKRPYFQRLLFTAVEKFIKFCGQVDIFYTQGVYNRADPRCRVPPHFRFRVVFRIGFGQENSVERGGMIALRHPDAGDFYGKECGDFVETGPLRALSRRGYTHGFSFFPRRKTAAGKNSEILRRHTPCSGLCKGHILGVVFTCIIRKWIKQ